jgi:NADP-reducing hydrogenase subunit HndB
MSAKITSVEELKKLREQARSQVDLRSGPKENRITVHMGTCGIAAGARDILATLAEELGKASVGNVNVTLHQSGCIGLCDQEPMLTYTDKAGRDYLYVRLTREKARQFVASHILAGRPVAGYILEGGKQS